MKFKYTLPIVLLIGILVFCIFSDSNDPQIEKKTAATTQVGAQPREVATVSEPVSQPADVITQETGEKSDGSRVIPTAQLPENHQLAIHHSVAPIPNSLRFFGKGYPFGINDLPEGNLKKDLLALSPANQIKALDWLHSFSFSGIDAVESLRADSKGGIYYKCSLSCAHCTSESHDTVVHGKSIHDEAAASTSSISSGETAETTDAVKTGSGPSVAAAPVSVNSPPLYNSKPGSVNTMYLDFNGAVITGKIWNSSRGVASWTAKAYSSDGDLTTFSDAEQTFIRRVWERIAEDYAPFDINITTDVAFDPDNYTGDKNKVAWNLFCPRVDANGVNLPHFGSGGVAYVGVFGLSNYFSTYQPAFTKAETNESADYASEAGSHEVGHNMGLSHDTRSNEGYYGGHTGAGAPTWGPIMGTGYNRNLSQWSKGEYFDSKHADWNGTSYDNNPNTNDDLAIIAGKTSYRTDDHGNTNGSATVITAAGDGSFNRTGIIERTSEADVFSFATGAGSVTINANPFKSDASTWGGNLDINLELYNAGGTLIASNNPNDNVTAALTTTLAAGTYYIHVKPSSAGTASGTGSPYDSVDGTRAGYTVYGSLGKYTISGAFILPGVNIVEAGGTNAIEGGATDTYTISLGTAPTSNVTVSISPNAQVTTSNSSVTFTTANWNTPQTVTVTAVNDATIEGNHTGLITHAATSSDPSFNGVSIGSVIVNITDNDDIVLTAPNGGESWMASSTQTITWTSLMGGNVKLELFKNGLLDSVIIASTPNDGSHSWTIPTGQSPGTNYQVRISSVEIPASSDVSLANFAVSPIPSTIASQNFDAAATFPTDWSNTTSSGTAAWTISTTKSHTPTRSAFVSGPSAVAQAYLTSTAMAIPSGTTGIQFSFYHDYNMENGWDGGLLEFSIDGGAWFDVTSAGSGVSFAQNGYNLGSLPSNYGNPLGGRAAWSGNSGGFVQTILNLTDTAKYAGKTLSARWAFGSDNAVASPGWYVDTVELKGISAQGMLVSSGDLTSTGNYGGPFTPASTAYTITNIGSSSINWTAAKTASWVTLSSAGGSLAAGANTTVTVSINSNANTLAATSHSDTVTFTNTSSGFGNATRSVGLTIGKANQTITFGALSPVLDNVAPFALTGTASSGLTVAYASSTPAVATVSGNMVTVVGAGSTTITASQAGDSNYNAATSVPQVLTVRRFNPLAVPGGPYKVLVGQTLALDGSASLPSGVSTISSYSWDLNNDGTFGDVTGATPAAIPFATLVSTWGMIEGVNTIQLRVTDSAAKTSTVSTTVQLVYTLTWDANGATAGQSNGAAAWLGANQWWDGAANQTWAPGSKAVFGGPSTAGGAVTLASPTSVDTLTFNTFTGTYTLGTAAQALTIRGGINKTAASATVSMASPIILGAPQTWTNHSGSGLTLASTLDNGGFLLTLDGTGTTTMKAGTISGAGGLTKNGVGFSEIGGQSSAVSHSYTGTTTINGGVLRVNGDVGIAGNLGSGNLTLNGGVLEYYSGGTFIRTLGAGVGEVQLLGGASGFGCGNSVTFTLNNNAAFEPVWGSAYFNPSTLVLNASTSAGTTTVANKLDLNGATRTIQVNAGTAAISGVIRSSIGTAGLTKDGAGTLILNGVNTYTGDTTINGGVLRIGNNSAGALASGDYGGNIVVAGGSTLAVWSSSSQILSGNISGNGNVQKAYGNTLTLSGNNTYTGKTSIVPQNGTGGGLSVASFNSVNGGTPLLASSSLGCPTTVADGTVTVGNSAQQAGCSLTYTGTGETTDRIIELQFNSTTKHTMYASGSGLLKFTSPFAVIPGTGTTAGGLTLRGAGNGEVAGIATAPGLLEKLDAGTWTIRGATSFAGATTITGGTLALGANNVLSDTTAVSIGAATLNAATFTDTVGTLDVTSAANINLGSGGALAFADSSAIDWTGGTLNITGTFTSGASLRFGTSNTGLTSTQLSKLSGAGFSSFGLNANGYLTASNDSAPPTLASSNLVDNKGGGPIMVNTQVTYTVTFSEDMDATTVTAADFGNAGTSAVTIGTVTETAPGVFTVLATPTNAGTLILRVNAAAVLKDVGGNSLDTTAAISDDTTITVDGTAPTLAAANIVDNKGGARVMPNTLVIYTVTFSEDMDASTVTAADFGNAGTSALTIGTVTETTPGVFSVEATPTSVGTLQLRVIAASVLKDVAGNNLNTGSAITDTAIITVETTLPTLAATSIVDNKSGAPVMPNTLVTYTVTFSEDMDAASVTAADFGNTGTAALTIGTVTETTATSGIFTVQATPTSAGTLVLSVNASAVLTDVAGNALDTSAAIADNTTITVENTLPTLAGANVVDNKSGAPIMANTLVTYTVTFSEDMDATTVTSADFGNAGTSTVTIGTVTEISPGVFTVPATPTNNGTLLLRVNAAAVLKDVAGNSLDTTAAIPDDTTITVDGVVPTLAGTNIVDNKSGGPVMVNTLVTYSVTFSEDMDATTVTAADFGNAGTATVSIGTVTETTPGVFSVQATPTTAGTLILRVNATAVLKDVVGNNLSTTAAIPDNTTITVDGVVPTLGATNIVDNKSGAPVTPNTLVTYTVTFSEDMDATSVTAADFGNTGTAALTIGTVTETTPGVFSVQATPTSAGTLILSVNASAVLTDVAGNALNTSAAIADNTTITVEGTLPTLAGANFVDNKSGAPIMANTLVTYTVTFSEDMDATTVTAADFGNAGTSTVSIGTVTETTPGVFTVPATPTTNGTLMLRVNATAVLKDVAGNSLDTTTAISDDTTVTVDGVVPTLATTAIVDNRSGSPLMPNTLVTYTVTFSEDMDATTVTAADFSNAGTSAVTIGTVTETTPGVFLVQATPTNVGTLKLRVTAAAVLKDAVGNNLNTAAAIADDTTLTVETTVPTLAGTNFVDNKSGGPVMVNTLVTYTVTFSEDMDATTVTAASFGNAGTAAVSIGTVTETTPGVFSVQATPTTAGTLILRVNAAAVLKDVAGNSLNTAAAIPDNTTITVDGAVPTLGATNIVDNKSGAAQAVNTLVTYTVTFSEDMDATTVTAADFGNAGTATVTIGTVTETTATSGIFTVQATPTSTGTLILKVNAGADLKDVAGNSLNTTADIADNTTITVDGSLPTLASNAIVDNKGGSPVMPNTAVTYTVTFSKDMDATTVAAADFGNAGTSTVTIGTVTETTPGVFTVLATPTSVGTLKLRVNQAAVLKDVLGNSLDTTSAIADDTTITVENTVPTLAGTSIVDDKSGTPVMPNTLVTYTVTFSEDMDATTVTTADFGNAGTSAVTIGTVTETSPGVFTVLATPTNAGTLILRVIATSVLKDVAGNSLNTTAAIPDNTTITVDATVPTLAGTNFVDDKSGAPVAVNSVVTYTVTFNEDMDASTVTSADFGNGGTSAVTFGTVSETTPGVFSVQVTPTTVGTLILRVNAAAVLKDVAGNSLNTTAAIADNTTISVISSYASWSGGGASDADSNNDGVRNGVAWVLGGNNVSTNATALLPTMDATSDVNYLIYNYRRSDQALADPKTTITVEYGGDLSGWTSAVADGTNIIITPSNDFYGAGVDKVEVKIKRTLAPSGRLFTRLKVAIVP